MTGTARTGGRIGEPPGRAFAIARTPHRLSAARMSTIMLPPEIAEVTLRESFSGS